VEAVPPPAHSKFFDFMRAIRTPDEVESSSLGDAEERRRTVEENVLLEKLAREIIEKDGRPVRDDAVPLLIPWLRDMLSGPASPLNKKEDFMKDILALNSFTTDCEIYLESLGCVGGRPSSSEHPPPSSRVRFSQAVLRGKCEMMVEQFSTKKDVTDESLKRRATDEFFRFFVSALTGDLPPTYNSYTGMTACMADMHFLRQSQDIVLFHLKINKTLPEELVRVDRAPPSSETVAVYIVAMSICFLTLPSLGEIDSYATVETFSTPVFGDGPLNFSPLALGTIRLLFAFFVIVVTREKLKVGSTFKIVRLRGSKLHGGICDMSGWYSQCFFTAWSWNILGLAFFLSGLIPMLVHFERESTLTSQWILRSALVAFEVAAPCAFLTSFIVTYALWPRAFKDHGSNGTIGFRGWINLCQHNGNIAMVMIEVALLGGIPVIFKHAALAPTFAGFYQLFLWNMSSRFDPSKGPVFPYFFLDTTLGTRTTVFMMVLLTVMIVCYGLFAYLDYTLEMIERAGYGVAPNLLFIIILSKLLMKFRD